MKTQHQGLFEKTIRFKNNHLGQNGTQSKQTVLSHGTPCTQDTFLYFFPTDYVSVLASRRPLQRFYNSA